MTVVSNTTGPEVQMSEHVEEFTRACSRVEPEDHDVSNASAAHLEVREVLKKDETLKGYGIDTILIGSYAREVSIRRVNDVDVFSMLSSLPANITSTELLQLFIDALEETYDDRLALQDRSILVDFPESGLHVDAVPARPCGDAWEIPDRVPAGETEAWQETDPEELGSKSTAMNKRFGGNYVPVVKLIRQTRRAQLGEARPGGLFFEVLTYHAFDGMDTEMESANRAKLYVAALQSIATQLADFRDGEDIEDPALPGKAISIRATQAQRATAASVFADVASRAASALTAAACPSAKAFQDLLGKNSNNEWVFQMPSYCNPDGTDKPVAAAASRSVPAGDQRFA